LVEFVVFDQRRLFNYRTPIHRGIAQLAFKVRADNIGVRGPHGKTKQTALERYCRVRAITLEAVGCLWLWGANGCESLDSKHYARKEDLIGYFEARRAFQAYLDAENGKSLGPPSERPGWQQAKRHYHEALRRPALKPGHR
jgi:hypothetical protein